MNKFLLFLVLTTSFTNLYAQWKIDNISNYDGDINIAYVLSNNELIGLGVKVENRMNQGYIFLRGKNNDFGINPLSDMDYDDYGVTFKFDNDPKVYYSDFTNLIIQKDFFWLIIGKDFSTKTKIKGLDNPTLGVKEGNLYTEDKNLLWKGIGYISSLTDFIDKIKGSTTMYSAFWTDSGVKYQTFNLKGSASAITKIFNPKYTSSIPRYSTTVSKLLTNQVSQESSSNRI